MTETTTSRTSVFTTLKRYAILAYGAVGTMLDVGLMVLGSVLVGLSIAVLLSGFDVVDVVNEELSTGAMLTTALVLGVVGLFCLGVASEGPLGRGRRLTGFALWEVGIGRTLAVFGLGFGAVLLYGAIRGLINDLPGPFYQGTEVIRVVGVSGMTIMPLLGVPLSLLVRWSGTKVGWLASLDVPVMYVVWIVSTMWVLT